jgi:kynurenine formamidase
MTETTQESGASHSTGRRAKLTMADVRAAAERLKNWNRWGAEDEVGTLNHVHPEDIVAAARLVQKGKVMSLALPFDSRGPQGGRTDYAPTGRFNPVHLMLRTGTDAYSGVLDSRGIRTADDVVIMPMQCGTQWDALSHVFYGNEMWNGYDCRSVTSFGARKCGIEKTKQKMVGRGVLLDMPRLLGQEILPDGFAVSSDLLDRATSHFKVEVRRGDFLIVRTGHMERKLADRNWDGYCGGDAPGLAFETLDWLHKKEVAAIATDTWGVAADCAADSRYEFMFVAPTLPVTGAVGSPTNPLAIK